MIDEVLYMEARIFREFCSRFGFSTQRANGIFNAHKIWQYIESCYDLFHTCGDEYILNDIIAVLKREGADLQPGGEILGNNEKNACADMILADAIEDMADDNLWRGSATSTVMCIMTGKRIPHLAGWIGNRDNVPSIKVLFPSNGNWMNWG